MKLSDISSAANITTDELVKKVTLPDGVTLKSQLTEKQAREITSQLQPSKEKPALMSGKTKSANSTPPQPQNIESDDQVDLVAELAQRERQLIVNNAVEDRLNKAIAQEAINAQIDEMVRAYIEDGLYPENPETAQKIAALGELERERRRREKVVSPYSFTDSKGEFQLPPNCPNNIVETLVRSGTPIGQRVAQMQLNQLEAGK